MQREEFFEWDDAKARANWKKHGVTFEEACAIWDDPYFYQSRISGGTEDRYLVIGKVSSRVYLSAIVTFRGREGESIRLISARKLSKREIGLYYG